MIGIRHEELALLIAQGTHWVIFVFIIVLFEILEHLHKF